MKKRLLGLASAIAVLALASCGNKTNSDITAPSYNFEETKDEEKVAQAFSFASANSEENNKKVYAQSMTLNGKTTTTVSSAVGVRTNSIAEMSVSAVYSIGKNEYTDYSNDVNEENEKKALEELKANLKFEMIGTNKLVNNSTFDEEEYKNYCKENSIEPSDSMIEQYKSTVERGNFSFDTTMASFLESGLVYTESVNNNNTQTTGSNANNNQYTYEDVLANINAIETTKELNKIRNESNSSLDDYSIDFSKYSIGSYTDLESDYYKSTDYVNLLNLVKECNMSISKVDKNNVTFKFNFYTKYINFTGSTNTGIMNKISNLLVHANAGSENFGMLADSNYDFSSNLNLGTVEYTFDRNTMLLKEAFMKSDNYDELLNSLITASSMVYSNSTLEASYSYKYNDDVKFTKTKNPNIVYVNKKDL